MKESKTKSISVSHYYTREKVFPFHIITQGKEEVRFMICPACGAHLDDDSKFCEVCGSRIGLSDPTPAAVPEMPEATEAGKTSVSEKPYTAEAEKVSAAEKPYTAEAEKVSAAEKQSTAAAAAKETIAAHSTAKSLPGNGDKAASPGAPVDRRIKIIGLSVGTVIMIIGFIRIASAGTSISSTSFGGDFYTYTYQCIVAVAEALAAIEVTLGWILAAIGAAIDILSLRS